MINISIGQSSQIGLTIGLGLPISDFADTDGDNNDAGLAQPGFQVEALFDYGFSENLGITGSLQYGKNSIDEDVLDDFVGEVRG